MVVQSNVDDPCLITQDNAEQIPFYNPASTRPLTVCRFRCMLQDTGYALEVYMPPAATTSTGTTEQNGLPQDSLRGQVDWGKLKERWVGWGVE